MHLTINGCLQSSTMLTHCLKHSFVAFFSKHGVEVHNGPVHLGVDINGRYRHQIETLVVDLDQLFGNDLSQDLRQTGRAGIPMRRASLGLASI